MCKLKKSTVVKTLLFVGGVLLAYKMVTMGSSEQIVIDGQTFKVYGKDAGDFVKTIAGGEES
jgi:hypothetical protein